jgi:hypothetical protein
VWNVVYGPTAKAAVAALIGLSVAALITVLVYILAVIASFFVAMPAAARNDLVVGGLLTVIFAATLVVTFREVFSRFRL